MKNVSQKPMSQEPTTVDDKQAIRHIVQDLENAWNSGDADAWSAHMAAGIVHTVWNGLSVEGKETLTAAHHGLFNGVYKGTRQKFTVRWVRFLHSDVAAVQFDGGLIGREDIPKVRPLAILTKQAGRWLVEVFQNTPILPQPGAAENDNGRSTESTENVR